MGDSDTWPASEAELLDIARDEGIDDPGNDPHMLPEKDCTVRIKVLSISISFDFGVTLGILESV